MLEYKRDVLGCCEPSARTVFRTAAGVLSSWGGKDKGVIKCPGLNFTLARRRMESLV